MVVDTSIILAIYFEDPMAQWASQQLNRYFRSTMMSTINLAEALIVIRSRQPRVADEMEARLLSSTIRFIPPDADQARIVAQARLRFPLNLGDCFAYALAKTENCPILTLDQDFRALDCSVILP